MERRGYKCSLAQLANDEWRRKESSAHNGILLCFTSGICLYYAGGLLTPTGETAGYLASVRGTNGIGVFPFFTMEIYIALDSAEERETRPAQDAVFERHPRTSRSSYVGLTKLENC